MKSIFSDLLVTVFGAGEYSDREVRVFGVVVSVLIAVAAFLTYSKLF